MSTCVGFASVTVCGATSHVSRCEENLRVWTTTLRIRSGVALSAVVMRVAVRVCVREERLLCRHWGVSAVKGIENGTLDGTVKDELEGWVRA